MKAKKTYLPLFLFWTFALIHYQYVQGAPIEVVTTLSDNGIGSLRNAVLNVDKGGTILFDPSFQLDTLVLSSGPIVVQKNLKIIGPGKDHLVLTTQGQSRVFIQLSGTLFSINGLTIFDASVRPGSLDRDSKGGAIYSKGRLLIENSDIKNCSSRRSGGAIYADTLTMRYTNVLANHTVLYGGGIYANVADIRNSTISYNRSSGYLVPSRNGPQYRQGCAGGIFAQSNLYISQSTIAHNECDQHGGGIYFFNPNATHRLNLINTLITHNKAAIGGGLFEELGEIGHFVNNIIALNTSTQGAPDIFITGNWTDTNQVNANLIGILDGSILLPGANNIIGSISDPVDPLIDSLKINGGLTLTSKLLDCSPAIDKGVISDTFQFDQNGLPRVMGIQIDLGPTEYQEPYENECFPTPTSWYTLISTNKIKLRNNNLLNGGIGLLDSTEKVILEDRTMITGPSTFVKAKNIELKDSSLVDNLIYGHPEIKLPPFINNLKGGKNSIKIEKNTVVDIADSIFKKITIEDNATANFLHHNIYCEDLILQDSAVLNVSDCSNIYIENDFQIRENCTINAGNKGLNIYTKDADIEEGAHIIANIYCSNNLDVRGKELEPSFLKGQYIAKDIDAEKYVTWDWNFPGPCTGFFDEVPQACADFSVDAGIDKGVLYSRRFNFLNRYSCVILEANVSGGTPPYSYEWTPATGLSNPGVLMPTACPTETTTYVLTATDAQGCQRKDSVRIDAFEVGNVWSLPRCENENRFKVAMCDIATGETICVSILSSSEKNGLGPNLNRGNKLGSCEDQLISNPVIDYKSDAHSNHLVWPNPSTSIINFKIPQIQNEEFILQIYDATGVLSYHKVITSTPGKIPPDRIQVSSLNKGIYYYKVNSKSSLYSSGKFIII